MLVSLTVGKVDAGVAVLLTEDKRLIEFPSILLPPDIHSGSIVDINVARNQSAELVAEQRFGALQADLYHTFGTHSPAAPALRCRNATQTSVVLEWDPLQLATAELRSLSLYRNNAKVGVIPPGKLSTKISGLALDTAYTFHLVMRTSAGQYSSERLTVKTHKMTDLHGITVTPGIMPAQLKESLADTVNRMGAKVIDSVRIDTTHFVCIEPRGPGWEKAVEMNVPVVVPDWVKGCEREGRIVGVRSYYLDADPSKRQIGPPAAQQQQQQQQRGSVSTQMRDSPTIEHTPPTPEPRHVARTEHQNGAPASSVATEATATRAPVEGLTEDAHPDAEEQSVAGTTLAEKGGKEDEEDDGDEGDEDDDDDEEDDDDKTEKGVEIGSSAVEKESSPRDGPETKEDETGEREAMGTGEEEGNFDEVAL